MRRRLIQRSTRSRRRWSTALTATFTYHSNENSTFLCSLDGGAAVDCMSSATQTYINLTDGHTFSVAAKDQVGNVDPTPAISFFGTLTQQRRTPLSPAGRQIQPRALPRPLRSVAPIRRAIALSVAWTALQLISRRVRARRPTPVCRSAIICSRYAGRIRRVIWKRRQPPITG